MRVKLIDPDYKVHDITGCDIVGIGRNPRNSGHRIVISRNALTELVSKHHCTIHRNPDGYEVYDGDRIKGSTNGTYVCEGRPESDGDDVCPGEEDKVGLGGGVFLKNNRALMLGKGYPLLIEIDE